jgi:putative PEP-CTERM system TPR-repeat lipoprotein
VKRLNPSFTDVHLPLAKVYLSKGEIDKTFKEAKLYMKSAKDDPEAYEVMAAAYAARRDFENAELMLNASQKVSPKRVSSKIALARIYLRNGNTDGAETIINEIIEDDDSNKNALYLLASVKRKQGKGDEELEVYEKINELDPKDITAKFQTGFHYLMKHDIQKAKEIAKEIRKAHRRRPEGHYLMGLVFYFDRKIDDAIISLQKAVKIAPIPGGYYYLGLCHLSKGNFEQAVSEFQRVVDAKPGMIQPRLLLAVTHLKAGRIESAEKEAKEVIEMDDRNAFAHNLMGSIYLAQGKSELAMEEIDRAIEINPDFIDAILKKGAISHYRGDTKKAEQDLIEAVEVAPDLLNTRAILSKYYIKNGKYDDALKTLTEGLKNNSNDALLYNIMGAAYLGKKEVDKALQQYEKAKDLNPKLLLPYYSMGLIYTSQGEKDKAIMEYEKVLEMKSDDFKALILLARIMESDRKEKEALDYYLRAKKHKKSAAYVAIAEFYLRRNEDDRALKELEEALSMNPKNIRVINLMGSIYMKKGDYQSAVMQYRNIAAVHPELGSGLLVQAYSAMGNYDSAIEELKGLIAKNNKEIRLRMKLAELYIKKKSYKEAEDVLTQKVSWDILLWLLFILKSVIWRRPSTS